MENLTSNDLRGLIKILVRNLGVLDKSQLSCCEVSLAQCHAIVEIGGAKEITLNQLAALLNLDNSTMSRTVNNLVKQGFVKRNTNDDDRRYISISLTEEGSTVFNQIEDNMKFYYEDILSRIPENKREQVLESIEILVNAIDHKCCK